MMETFLASGEFNSIVPTRVQNLSALTQRRVCTLAAALRRKLAQVKFSSLDTK